MDVLSFSTAVDIAVARGAQVFPSRFKSLAESAQIAAMYDALLAVPRDERSATSPYTLSPSTLDALPSGARLVLPSPNGARCVRAAYERRVPVVIVGCLRNVAAVAAFARARAGDDGAIAVIAAGERWPDGTLRPAIEDDLGAGAILAALDLNTASPEAVTPRLRFGRWATRWRIWCATASPAASSRKRGLPTTSRGRWSSTSARPCPCCGKTGSSQQRRRDPGRPSSDVTRGFEALKSRLGHGFVHRVQPIMERMTA